MTCTCPSTTVVPPCTDEPIRLNLTISDGTNSYVVTLTTMRATSERPRLRAGGLIRRALPLDSNPNTPSSCGDGTTFPWGDCPSTSPNVKLVALVFHCGTSGVFNVRTVRSVNDGASCVSSGIGTAVAPTSLEPFYWTTTTQNVCDNGRRAVRGHGDGVASYQRFPNGSPANGRYPNATGPRM